MNRRRLPRRIAFALATLAACAAPLQPAIAGSRITEPAEVAAPAPPDTFTPPVAMSRPASFRPGEALAIGLLATAAPMALASGGGRGRGGDRTGAVVLCATAGAVVGPAIGLAAGGRGDLAARGVAIRVVSLGAAAIGVLGVAASMSGSSSQEAGVGALGLMAVGGAVAGLSAVYDLAITPSAVAQGRPHAALGVRPDGKVAVSVTF